MLRTLFGAWAVLSILQFFLAEIVVVMAWAGPAPYSWVGNYISDLGALNCGLYQGREVCSPLNGVMNASFILQGLGLLAGGFLMSTRLLGFGGHPEQDYGPQLRAAQWVRVLLIVAGLGVTFVGLVPEDTISQLHYSAAILFFVSGVIAQFVLWWIWTGRSWASWILLATGIVSALATAVFIGLIMLSDVLDPYAGLVERLIASALATAVFIGLIMLSDVLDPYAGLVERLIAYPVILGFSVMGATVALGANRERKRQI